MFLVVVFFIINEFKTALPEILLQMSRLMRKPTICIGENKDADAATAKLISAFILATWKVQFLFLSPKFQASSRLLCFYNPLCVRPVRKPHCWFSHEAAQIFISPYSIEILRFFPHQLLRDNQRDREQPT